jgi:DNA topoisomerase-1
VYELIWKRTMACQMADARGRRMILDVTGSADGREAVFQARGSVIDFPGFLRAYVEGSDDPNAKLADRDVILPNVEEGDALTLAGINAESHVTTPPARLTEATLVKQLEESGVGRPSTYASIIETIVSRDYSFRKGTALVPTFTAFAVVRLMSEHLPDLVDYEFTARMEDRLDSIARGDGEPTPYLKEFYFGDGVPGLRPMLDKGLEEIDARSVCTISLGVDGKDREVAVRVGKFGPYLQRGEDTGNVPDGTCPDELDPVRASELIDAAKKAAEPIGTHPETNEPVYVKSGRYGPYVQMGEPKGKGKDAVKPKMVSLLKGQQPADVTFEMALELLQLPRTLGEDADGKKIEAGIGRYGPYVKRDRDFRSLTKDDNVLTVGLPRALELLAQQKRGRGSRATAEPIKVFEKVEALGGVDVKLLEGRYGPYVTDGKANGSLPKGADPKELRVEEVVELIEAARARGPRKKRTTRRRK